MKKALAAVAAMALGLGLAGIGGIAASATDAPDTIRVYWAMDDYVGGAGDTPDAQTATWPQTYSPDGATKCGVWYQHDDYRFDDTEIPDISNVPSVTEEGATYKEATTALWADGKLTKGDTTEGPEDSGLHSPDGAWGFEYGGDCAPTVVMGVSTVCGSLALAVTTTDINADWSYGPKATIDGIIIGSAVVKGSDTKTTVIPFTEDQYGGSVDVIVETYASTEQDLLPEGWEYGNQRTITVDTDCEPAVVVADDGPRLADTGVMSMWLMPVGALVLLAGAGLVLWRHKALS